MNREKQIEEMTEIVCSGCVLNDGHCGFANNNKLCPTVLEDCEALYNAGYRKQSDKFLIKENGDIVNLSAQTEWISVEENPTENGTYLCYGYWIGSGRYHIDTAEYFDEWDIVNNFVLTHWMPLPEPPKMKGGEQG